MNTCRQLQIGHARMLTLQHMKQTANPLCNPLCRFFIMAEGLPDEGLYKGQPLKATVARDTVTVNANSYLVIRFFVANPGVWIFHCQ
jgi:FtsP/CotA-like multicopper oxidase with cupredoxin domain